MKDVRSKKVIFVAYCLLDQNARATGIAKYSGPVHEVLETLMRKKVGIIQMPCPELLHKGLDRLPYPRNWYDNKEFRRVCRRCAQQVVKHVMRYVENKYQVVGILGIENSPSCAVEVFQSEGKRVKLVKSKGIFIEELLEEFRSKGLNNIPIIEMHLNRRRIKTTCKELEKLVTSLEL